MKRTLIFIFLLTVTGCNFYQVKGSLIIKEKDADKAWSKTQSYIALNSTYKIDVVSDYVIKTGFFNSSGLKDYGLIGYTVTRELNDDNCLFIFKLDSWAFDNVTLKNELVYLKNYIISDNTTIDNNVKVVDNTLGTLDDIPRHVFDQALKEMSEKELKIIIEGLSKKSLEAITIEQIRKLYRIEYRE